MQGEELAPPRRGQLSVDLNPFRQDGTATREAVSSLLTLLPMWLWLILLLFALGLLCLPYAYMSLTAGTREAQRTYEEARR